MSIRKLLLMSMLGLAVQSFAVETQDGYGSGKDGCTDFFDNYSTFCNSSWGSNWFIGAQGGASVFAGTPLGCGDVFDRLKPCLNVHVGKWINPTVGLRIAGQGFRLTDSDFQSMKYSSVHADLMYNVSNLFHDCSEGLPRWDFIPYIGVGIFFSDKSPGGVVADVCSSNINHPFTITYGFQVSYRLTERFHATAEVGGLSTFQSFDGRGSASKFGDNLFSLSAGLSYVIGRAGWKSCRMACGINSDSKHEYVPVGEDKEVMRGDKYGRNDYSGLNALRARLSELDHPVKVNGKLDSIVAVGIPVYFFFKINTDELIDECQKINLDEIAKIVKERKLCLRITGAADSATGSPDWNKELSKKRARRIAKELKDRGVDLEQMKGFSCGGIDTYEPDKANRFTKVVLSHF